MKFAKQQVKQSHYPCSEQQRCSADLFGGADLHLCCSHMQLSGFLTTGLKCNVIIYAGCGGAMKISPFSILVIHALSKAYFMQTV